MKFNSPEICLTLLYDAWFADQQGRAQNRARVQEKADGFAPYTDEEANADGIVTNVNFLEMCSLLQSARRQFANAYFKPGRYFTVNLDVKPVHKRDEWGSTITTKLNRALKRSMPYLETLRSEFANVVLHGIGPTFWDSRDKVVGEPLGVEDVLIPSGTRLMMDNLPWFGVWRQWTAMELYQKTHGGRVDPAWNMAMVEDLLKWAGDQYAETPSYATSLSPEKVAEMVKEGITAYPLDRVPTIDVWCFYYYDMEGDDTGWKQKVVLDNFAGESNPEIESGSSEFLYDPGKRGITVQRENLIHFSFGDLSAKAPFKYHTVRSLGWLLFAVCQLQDRLQCRLNDAAFESMLNFFRVTNPDDADRLQKIDLVNKGVIPDGLEFVKAADRWNINPQMTELAMETNRGQIAEHSASYVQDFDATKKDARETATKTQQKAQQAAAMVGAMLALSYEYQMPMYLENCRRICIPNSRDPMARQFRLECLKEGVPEEALNSERWDLQVERVLGGGVKAVELAQAGNLFGAINQFAPESQRMIRRRWVLAQTDDPQLTEELEPDEPLKVTDSVHDAELAAAALLMGLPVTPKTGQNHAEYAMVLLKALGLQINQVMQTGGVAKPEQLQGFQNLAQNISQHIALLAQQAGPQDSQVKQQVKQLQDVLTKQMNAIKGMAQRLQEMMKKQQAQQGQGQIGPEERAKLQFEQAKMNLKLQAQAQSHAQRFQQRNQQFLADEQRADVAHGLSIRQKLREHAANLTKTGMEMRQKAAQPQTVEK